MTSRTVIAALGLAILLGGICWLIVGARGGAAPSATLGVGDLIANVDAFSADFVKVTFPDGRVDEATRESVNAPWLLTLTRSGGSEDSPTWPLEPAQMSRFLRIVQSAQARAVPERGSSIGKDAVVLELPAKAAGSDANTGEKDFKEAATVRIRFGGRRLGGNVLAEITDPTRPGGDEPHLAVVSEELLRAITQPGLSGWRETAVLPDASRLTSRITFSRPDTSFTLARVNGRWRLTSPFSAPADEEKLPTLLKALEQVRITDFLDVRQPTEAEAGLDEPMASLHLESDRPEAGPARTLTIGSPVGAGVGGGSGEVFARLGDQPHIVRIDATALTTLPGAAVALIEPAATAVPVGDIFNLALRRLDAAGPEMVYRKQLDRWGEVNTGGEVLVLDDAGAAQISELLQFLTTVKPERIAAGAPDPFAPLGTITLGSLGASPLDELTIGVVPTDESVNIVLASRAPVSGDGADGAAGGESGVFRIYKEGSTPLLLRRFLSGEGGAFEPITAPAATSDPSAK